MTSFDDVRDLPLTSDRQLVDHLENMIDVALCRQVWLMFLDGDDYPLPILMPTFVPARPRKADVRRVGGFIRDIGGDVGATTVVLTYERRAGTALSAVDRLWLSTLRGACLESGLAFRGPYLCTVDGVVAVPPDDYL